MTIPYHLLALAGLFAAYFGLVRLNPWLIVLGYILFSGFGVAIGFHRLLSHRSFKTNPWCETGLSTLGCFAIQGSPIFWKAVHMGSHHPFSDQDGDLHSRSRGWWYAYMGWQMDLRAEQIPFLAAKDLLINRRQVFLHKNYEKIVWATVALVALLSPGVALSFFILPGIFALHTENVINSICHGPVFGYRSHPTKDSSRNVPLLGLLCFGQGWHNNHHYRPRAYDYGGARWFEFDPCAWIVPLLATRTSKTP